MSTSSVHSVRKVHNLRLWALGQRTGLELLESEYESVVAAMHRVYLASDLEEKLDILLENFMEYERDLLSLALQYSLFPMLDDHRIAVERQLVNRRITNLLSSARMYVDQMRHSISQLASGGSVPDAAALLSAAYDGHLEYRIAEALRNFSQHRALPVHFMNWPSRWDEMDTENRRLRFSVVPELSLEELEIEGEFKATVLDELRSTGNTRFRLTPILRVYVESLARVHKQVREAIAAQIESDHEVILRNLERARAKFGENLVALVASKGTDPGRPDEHHFVNERSWKRRNFLIAKNSSFEKLSRRVASAEHPSDVV